MEVPIEDVYRQIADLAREHDARRVILFGSRARADALPKSDIDLAVEGCSDFPAFAYDMQNRLWSLLMVDVVNLDEPQSQALLNDILRDGKVLYEKV